MTKRMTEWRGKWVAFNKKRTVFHEVTEGLTTDVDQYDSNGGRIMTGRLLELTEAEQKDVLRVWAIGKGAWMEERGL